MEIPGYERVRLAEREPLFSLFQRPIRHVSHAERGQYTLLEQIVLERMLIPTQEEILTEIRRQALDKHAFLVASQQVKEEDAAFYLDSELTEELLNLDPEQLEILYDMGGETEGFLRRNAHPYAELAFMGTPELLRIRVYHVPATPLRRIARYKRGGLRLTDYKFVWGMEDLREDGHGHKGNILFGLNDGALPDIDKVEDALRDQDPLTPFLYLEKPTRAEEEVIDYETVAPLIRRVYRKRGHLRRLPRVPDAEVLHACATYPLRVFNEQLRRVRERVVPDIRWIPDEQFCKQIM